MTHTAPAPPLLCTAARAFSALLIENREMDALLIHYSNDTAASRCFKSYLFTMQISAGSFHGKAEIQRTKLRRSPQPSPPPPTMVSRIAQ